MNPPSAPGERFELRFHRTMPLDPARLDADTALVQEMAVRLGGLYHGWTTELRRSGVAAAE